jgi:hypothetical protein
MIFKKKLETTVVRPGSFPKEYCLREIYYFCNSSEGYPYLRAYYFSTGTTIISKWEDATTVSIDTYYTLLHSHILLCQRVNRIERELEMARSQHLQNSPRIPFDSPPTSSITAIRKIPLL